MANEKLRQAVIWARKDMSVAAMARMVGIPRTTYDSYEKGKAEPPVEVLELIGAKRGLPSGWWKNYEPKQVDMHIHNRKRAGVESVPLLPVPSIGFITKGSLSDLEMQAANEPVMLPANMVRPEYVIALADVNDSGLLYPHGCPLEFDPTKTGVIGKKVSVELREGGTSLREMAWDKDHIVFRSFNGKPDLMEHECKYSGLLVGAVPLNKPGKFNAAYDEDGI